MPRGNPKTFKGVRLDPALLAAVQEHEPNLTVAVEEGLALWLKQARRKAAARHLAPPTAREIAARKTSDAA
jgi:hypothetical protein